MKSDDGAWYSNVGKVCKKFPRNLNLGFGCLKVSSSKIHRIF